MKRQLIAFALSITLTSCAEVQEKRDVAQAQLAQQYKTATSSGSEFDGQKVCGNAPAFKTWTALEFSPSSTIYTLPNGINAEAYCLVVPAGAKAIELYGGSKGGMTYYEATAIYPSVLLLGEKYELISDLQKPRLTAGEGFFSGLGISGIVPLVGEQASARYVVVYIHPLSTTSGINVHTAYKTIPVPYGPYGTVKARFFQ